MTERLAHAYAAAYAYSRFTSLDKQPITRAIEHVEFQYGSVLRTVTVTVSTPMEGRFRELSWQPSAGDELRGRFYIPLTAARRGQLLNSFRTVSENGSEVQVLHRSDAKRMARLVLALAWEKAFSDPVSCPSEQDRDRMARLRTAALGVPLLPVAQADSAAVSLIAELSSSKLPEGLRVDANAFERLKGLLTYFTHQTIIWAAVTGAPGQTFVLSYSYECTYSTSQLAEDNNFEKDRDRYRAAGTAWARCRLLLLWLTVLVRASRENVQALEFIRRITNHLPNEIVVPVGMLHLAESYHFGLEVPAGNYVAKQELVVRTKHGDELSRVVSPFREEFEAQLKAGADYRGGGVGGETCAHLYTYRLRAIPNKVVYAVVEFKERPPGTTGLALSVGRLVLALNLFLAAFFLLLIQLGESAVDVVAILLTVPVFATLWLGRSLNTDSESASRTPMLSKFATIAFGLLSAINALVLMLAIAVREAAHHPGWPVYLPFWIPIGTAALLNGWLVAVLGKRRDIARREYHDIQDKLPRY